MIFAKVYLVKLCPFAIIKNCNFPDEPISNNGIQEKITPLKKSYRPVNILFNIFKIYERCFYKQHVIFSQNPCGFRKVFSVVNCRLPMIEKWRKPFARGEVSGALLTDLSKTFSCLPLALIIAQPLCLRNIYGFTKAS